MRSCNRFWPRKNAAFRCCAVKLPFFAASVTLTCAFYLENAGFSEYNEVVRVTSGAIWNGNCFSRGRVVTAHVGTYVHSTCEEACTERSRAMLNLASRFGLGLIGCLSLGICAVQADPNAGEQSTKVTAKGEKTSPKLVATASGKKSAKLKEESGIEVELFRAIADKQLDVEYVAKDATQANLIFTNQSSEPLKIKLPETFGAVPVLAQGMGMGGMGGGGMGGGGMGGMGGMGGGGQGMGGGMMGGGGGMDMGGMGGGGMGMFRVEADKPRKMTVATVCLEHGKLDPNPRMKYKVVPLAAVNADPKIAELCKLLSQGKVSQNAAQAAAWHIANGLSWQELANKPKVISKYTGVELFFSPFEVQSAMRLVNKVTVEAPESESSEDSSYSLSSTSEEQTKE
jgi:hypothetical protein